MIFTFKTADEHEVSLNVRAVEGTRQDDLAPVYEILDASGNPTALSFDITVNNSRATGMYDCIQIEHSEVFAYSSLTKERSVKLGWLLLGGF